LAASFKAFLSAALRVSQNFLLTISSSGSQEVLADRTVQDIPHMVLGAEEIRHREDADLREDRDRRRGGDPYELDNAELRLFDDVVFRVKLAAAIDLDLDPDGITSISIYFIIRFGSNIAISGKKVMMKRMMTIGI